MNFLPLYSLLLIFISFSAAAQEEFQDFVSTSKVEVCTIPLPVTSHIVINRMIFNTKHIYLKVRGQTFGTPFTAKGSYFGGDAYLYSEDIFYQRHRGEGEECFPTHYSADDLEEKFERRLLCLAKKMVVASSKENETRQWYPVFDYHFLKNNCGSMANYLVECSGGKILKKINYSIGDKVEPNKEAKIIMIDSPYESTLQSSYGEICQIALDECQDEASFLEDAQGLLYQ